MDYQTLKRPAVYLPLGLLVLLAVAAGVVFNPGFQRQQLLKRVGPMVDTLSIGHIHITPWSMELDDVTVGYRGGTFHLDEGRIRYGLASLLLRKIKVVQLSLQGIAADLANFSPPETPDEPGSEQTPAEPFAGILAALDNGFAYVLEELGVQAEVRLAPEQTVSATLTGGGVRPESTGTLTLALQLRTGSGDDHIDLNGDVRLDQGTGGKFNGVESTLAILAALQSLPQPEQVTIDFSVAPDLPEAAEQLSSSPEATRRYLPEAMVLKLRQQDAEGRPRSAFELSGVLDGNTSEFQGNYQLTANERLLKPYAAGAALAPLTERLSGELKINLASVTGDLTFINDLAVTDLQRTYSSGELPELLRMHNDFRLSLLPDQRLRLATLATTVGAGDDQQALTVALNSDQDIPLNDVDGYLRQDNSLLSLELPELPLSWLNSFLPDYSITEGSLSGAFTLATDKAGTVFLLPQRPLAVNGLSIMSADELLVEGAELSLAPELAYTGDTLNLKLKALEIQTAAGTLATADLSALLPLAEVGRMDADAQLTLHPRPLTELLGGGSNGASKQLPDTIDLALKAGLLARDTSTLIESLDGSVTTSGGEEITALTLMKPVSIEGSAADGWSVSPAGKLATFKFSDIDLGWFAAFLEDGVLKGALRRADFTLVASDDGVLSFAPEQPFQLDGVTLATAEGPLLEDIGIRISPLVRMAGNQVEVAYEDLELTSRSGVLAGGRGTARLVPAAPDTVGAADASGTFATEGHLRLDFNGLAQQPLIADLLGAELNAPARLEADYGLIQQGNVLAVNELVAELFYDDAEPRMAVRANGDLRVRTSLEPGTSAADQASGELLLTVNNLTAEPFADILAARGVSFATVNGRALLSSDGSAMHLETDGPLTISGITIDDEQGPLLEPFALALDANVDVADNRLEAMLRQYRLSFAGEETTPAVAGTAEVVLRRAGDATQVASLAADVAFELPVLLSQPAVMPGNKLRAGKLQAQLGLVSGGSLSANLLVNELQARKGLPLKSLEVDLDGQLAEDGSFSLAGPVTTTGNSGTGGLVINARRIPGAEQAAELAIEATGEVVYLNDIINSLNAIAGRETARRSADQPAAPAADAESVIADDITPDQQPFWTSPGRGMQIDVAIEKLFYTDYFEIDDLTAHARVLPQQVALESLRASFHDSPLALDGILNFVPGPKPYDLKLNASVDQLDLATFFRKLDPEARPRLEGLVDFKVDAFGQAPNMPEFRNDLYFDLKLFSQDGIFHLMDPNSALIASSTGIASTVGAVVSYVPTGLFGIGAVPRLVAYIKDIDYDTVRVELVRGASRDVQIRQFVVQSEDVLLTAEGGVSYQPDSDVLHSPLTLDARLDMRGAGAAIMYDMNLLKNEKNRWNYWKGPDVQFRGTVAATESNLSEIISTAGRGMVLGGISRPISGLIGNVRHTWLEPREPALDYDGTPAAEEVEPEMPGN